MLLGLHRDQSCAAMISSFPCFYQQSEKEEDDLSVSTISRSSSYDWTTDEDDEEMSSVAESDVVDEEMQSMNDADEVGQEMQSMSGTGPEIPSMNKAVEDDTDDKDDEEMSSMKEADEAGPEIPNMNEAVKDDTAADFVLRSCSKSKSQSAGENKGKFVTDTTLEGSSYVPCKIEEGDYPYVRSLKLFKARQPLLEEWIDSWTQRENSNPGYSFLNVYGYFNKDKGYGGYGVILRNDWVQPVIVATCFTREGDSRLFQVLCGMKTGFELAVKHGCRGLSVSCNIYKVVLLFPPSSFKEGGSCSSRDGSHVTTDGMCKECIKRRVMVRSACVETLIPVMKELKCVQAKLDKYAFVFTHGSRDENEAAHYLAKMAKRNALEVNPLAPKESEEEIRPVDFPHKLRKILWNDAFGCDTTYSHILRSRMAPMNHVQT